MEFSDFAATFSGRPRGGHHYDPNQPRVPAGRPDGGQWTRGTGGDASISTEDKRQWFDIFQHLMRARSPVDELDFNDGAIDTDDPFASDDWSDTRRRWQELFRLAAEEQLRLPGMELPEQRKQPQLPAAPQAQPPESRPPQPPQARPPRPPRIQGGSFWGLIFGVAAEVALRLIDKYRDDNSDPDLFGHKPDPKDSTVAVTMLNGEDVYGVNSEFGEAYTPLDGAIANRLRGILNAKYPDVMKRRDNLGEMPNNAVYHAEVTVLLRAAWKNGRTLAGKTLEVFVDKPVCPNCEIVLPYVGLELGNPP